jgi:hypothetical protein
MVVRERLWGSLNFPPLFFAEVCAVGCNADVDEHGGRIGNVV